MKTKKMFALLLALCCILSTLFTISAFAEEDAFPYSFTMKANQGKSYTSESEKRTTPHTNNPWKVNMTFNAEGVGTIATYWIASELIYTQYSDSHNVVQGSGDHYYKAYESAENKWVKLGVKNNNNTATAYTVSGYWDEEVGYLMDGIN